MARQCPRPFGRITPVDNVRQPSHNIPCAYPLLLIQCDIHPTQIHRILNDQVRERGRHTGDDTEERAIAVVGAGETAGACIGLTGQHVVYTGLLLIGWFDVHAEGINDGLGSEVHRHIGCADVKAVGHQAIEINTAHGTLGFGVGTGHPILQAGRSRSSGAIPNPKYAAAFTATPAYRFGLQT